MGLTKLKWTHVLELQYKFDFYNKEANLKASMLAEWASSSCIKLTTKPIFDLQHRDDT